MICQRQTTAVQSSLHLFIAHRRYYLINYCTSFFYSPNIKKKHYKNARKLMSIIPRLYISFKFIYKINFFCSNIKKIIVVYFATSLVLMCVMKDVSILSRESFENCKLIVSTSLNPSFKSTFCFRLLNAWKLFVSLFIRSTN